MNNPGGVPLALPDESTLERELIRFLDSGFSGSFYIVDQADEEYLLGKK